MLHVSDLYATQTVCICPVPIISALVVRLIGASSWWRPAGQEQPASARWACFWRLSLDGSAKQ